MTGRRGERGFSLIEVIITTLILVVVLGAASSLFVNLLRAYKQQSKIAESGMEGILGLEILRRDLQHAGFGLPWNGLVAYSEAAAGANAVASNPPSNTDPPRALGSLDAAGVFGSDYLVVRSAGVGMSPASGKWTHLRTGPATRNWGSPLEDLSPADRVVVLSPGLDNATFRTLVTGGSFFTAFNTLAAFVPADPNQTNIVYGIDTAASLRMPFNRADYFVDTTRVPRQCAPNTGVLVKAVIGQADGLLSAPSFPLLDCVASMKVRYRLDTDGDGLINMTTAGAGGIAAMTAQQIRDQVKEVQVFVLAHDGQRDTAYTHSPNPVSVGGVNVNVDVNYRWRLYTMTFQPISLRD